MQYIKPKPFDSKPTKSNHIIITIARL